jgi:polyphosphate kinase
VEVESHQGDADHRYRRELHELQVELVKFQRRLIGRGERILVLLEGRDAAGKDGVIKRIVEHLSPRDTRVVALHAPSSRERSEWYFQRYVEHLPAAAEFVLFNRSWYNRAGVERVMEFCTEAEVQAFLDDAPVFEWMLVNSGIRLFKYYLVLIATSRKRAKVRRHDPLSRWKISPIDQVAAKHWNEYTRARDDMLHRTHSRARPGTSCGPTDKHATRINLMRHLLAQLQYRGKDRRLLVYDPGIVFTFQESRLHDGSMAK